MKAQQNSKKFTFKFVLSILVLIFLLLNNTKAQVGDILDAATKNADIGKVISDAGQSFSNSGCADGCADFVGSGCMNLSFNFFVDDLSNLNSDAIDLKDEIPTTFSFDVIQNFGFHMPKTYLVHPRVRGNLGFFSSDFRYTSMIETMTIEGNKYYNTYDWQVAQINILLTEPAIIRLGSGFMYEEFTKRFYNEHSAMADINLNNFDYVINAEFRVAVDYETGNFPRTEGNARFNYRILKIDHVWAYASGGLVYNNYYGKVDVFSVQGGLWLNFH